MNKSKFFFKTISKFGLFFLIFAGITILYIKYESLSKENTMLREYFPNLNLPPQKFFLYPIFTNNRLFAARFSIPKGSNFLISFTMKNSNDLLVETEEKSNIILGGEGIIFVNFTLLDGKSTILDIGRSNPHFRKILDFEVALFEKARFFVPPREGIPLAPKMKFFEIPDQENKRKIIFYFERLDEKAP
jgi:hypothetical protein